MPSVAPVWVRLPHLPLHCWNPKSLESIGNTLGKYIDKADRKEQYSCAIICVEFYLEVGLPEAIQLKVVDWSHIQKLDYKQLPFKCRYFDGYGHFVRHCKKKKEEEGEISKGEQWTKVQKASQPKNNNRSKGKGESKGPGASIPGKAPGEESSAPPISEAPNNPFEILNNLLEISNPVSNKSSLPQPEKNNGEVALPSSLIGTSSSPSYAEIAKKKPPKNFESSEDESFKRPSKRVGRKSHKETREEAERQKMQGIQSTIEMSIGRNTRTRPPKGGPTHSNPSK